MPLVLVNSTTPVRVAQKSADALLVRNAGAVTVYVGASPGVTDGDYDLSLASGGSLNWSGNDLWAICTNGQASQLEILYNGDTAVTAPPSVVSVITDKQTKTVLPLQNLDPLASYYFSGHLNVAGAATVMIHVICNTGDPNSPNGPDSISQIMMEVDHWTPSFVDGGQFVPGGNQAVTYAWGADTWWIINPLYTDICLSMWKNAHSFATQGFFDVQIEIFQTDKYIPASFSAVPDFIQDNRQTVPRIRYFPGVLGVDFNIGTAFTGNQLINCPSISGEIEVGAYDIYYQSPTSPDTFTLEFWTFGNSSGFGIYNDFITAKHFEVFQYTAAAGTTQRFKGSGGRFKNHNNRLFAFLSSVGGGEFQLGTFWTLNYDGSGMSWPQ